MLELRVLTGTHAGARVLLPDTPQQLGSDPSCDLVLSDEGLLARHAAIEALGLERRGAGGAAPATGEQDVDVDAVRFLQGEAGRRHPRGAVDPEGKVPERMLRQLAPPDASAVPRVAALLVAAVFAGFALSTIDNVGATCTSP